MLKAAKTRLTRARNILEEAIISSEDVLAAIPPAEDGDVESLKKRRRIVETRKSRMKAAKEVVDAAMARLETTFLGLTIEEQQQEQQSFESYLESANEVAMKAEMLCTTFLEIKAEMDLLILDRTTTEPPQEARAQTQQPPQYIQTVVSPAVASTVLPRLEIPRFGGKRAEWDNFWAIFKANIDDQQLSPLLKFNYLRQFLTGEARQLVLQFQINEANYSQAVRSLREKYGNDDIVVDELLAEIQEISAHSRTTKAQIQLLEKITALMTQLAVKGQDVDHRMLLNTIFSKFDREIQLKVLERRAELERSKEWTWSRMQKELAGVLERKSYVERIQEQLNPCQRADTKGNPERQQKPALSCIYCKRTNHISAECRTVPEIERIAFLTKYNLCQNCGKPNHTAEVCRNPPCDKCGEKHHSSICKASKERYNDAGAQLARRKNTRIQEIRTKQREPLQGQRRPRSTPNHTTISQIHQNAITHKEVEMSMDSQDETAVNHVMEETKTTGTVLLTGTTIVLGEKESKEVCVLLDTGSELSFVDAKLVKELNLPVLRESKLRVKTFGSNEVKENLHKVVKVRLLDKDNEIHTLRLFDSSILTGYASLPALSEEDRKFIKEKGISLCSPLNSQEAPQILLGCDQMWDLVEKKHEKLPSGLHLIATKFGYMISGRQDRLEQRDLKAVLHTMVKDDELELFDRYWSLESSCTNEYVGPEKNEQQRINDEVSKRFRETIERRKDGYYVHLPWKNDGKSLPSNKGIALKRLSGLWDQLNKRPSLLKEYDKIFKDQLEKGIIEPVPQHENNYVKRKHYLPHQVVITPDKPNTKMRIVFDASAHYVGKQSLNDALYQGPLFLPNLVGMMLRFRLGKAAIIADVEKAFLQVHLHESDRDATRFLWLKNITEPPFNGNIIEYRFTRVTFGLNASPFLLAATIRFHLESTQVDQQFAKELNDNLYVDNLVMTAESTEEGVNKYLKAKRMFNELNMNLREFISNDRIINQAIKREDRAQSNKPKVLGIIWNTDLDMFSIRCDIPMLAKITKRTVLHANASVYDPLGWMTPLLIQNKVFFQSLWKKEYSWDHTLDKEDQEKWIKLSIRTNGFKHQIPRRVADKKNGHRLVVFSDASSIAMATCAYLCQKGDHHLLIAKSKLPKIKENHTIPKLELNALTLSARLALNIVEETNEAIKIKEIYFLSDSEIALNWIKNSNATKSLGVLVTNRVREISRIAESLGEKGVDTHFGYVNTIWNPADCATRGLTAKELENHSWWKGPEFLELEPTNWPDETHLFRIGKQEVTVINTVETNKPWIDCSRFSSLRKMQRTTSWVLRFLRNTLRNLPVITKRKIQKSIPELREIHNTPTLNAEELKRALRILIKSHQRHYEEIINASSNLKLNILPDKEGIRVCQGRLGKSELQETTKNPIFIAPNSDLAKLIIQEAHGTLHRSTAHTMAEVRLKYWIPRLRQQVKKIVRRCIPCQKVNNLPYRYPSIKDMPRWRIVRSRPFEHIGLDYFGPLKGKTATGETKKNYGCILTCATTRLIHLELVSDNTAAAFVNALRRFIARRGVPATITSDNAPSFTLGEKVMEESLRNACNMEEVQSFVANNMITWKKITPFAPWQGGFYERLIQSVKNSLSKALGRRILDEDSLRTTLTEIEGCLNSRPLTYQESTFEESTSLRPIDFIQNHLNINYPMLPVTSEEDQDESYLSPEERIALKSRNQAVKALKSSCELTSRFWNIWHREYITALREQHQLKLAQGRSTNQKPTIGKIVLIQEEIAPRNTWKLGKITRLINSEQGEVREVELSTGRGNAIRRPVNLLIPLELDDSEIEQENERISNGAIISQNLTPYNLRSTIQKSMAEAQNEINYINIVLLNHGGQISLNDICFSMDPTREEQIKQMLNSLILRPQTVLNERILQEHIEALNVNLNKTLKDSEEELSRYKKNELKFSIDPTKSTQRKMYYTRRNTEGALILLRERLINMREMIFILWDTYDLMIRSRITTQASKDDFIMKKRIGKGPVDKLSMGIYITSELNSITNTIEEIHKYEYTPWEEEEPEQGPSTSHMRAKIAEPVTVIDLNQDDFKKELNDINLKMTQIEQMIKQQNREIQKAKQAMTATLEQKLGNFGGKLDEVIIQLRNQIETISKSLGPAEEEPVEELILLEDDLGVQQPEEKTPESPQKESTSEETTREPSPLYQDRISEKEHESPKKRRREQTPPKVAQARRKLDSLAKCKRRYIGDAPKTLLTPGRRVTICGFCRQRGKHFSDGCTIFDTAGKRRDLVAEENLCRRCLRSGCDEICDTPKCSYCRSKSHHEALCYLPEERKQLRAIVDEYENYGRGEYAETYQHQDNRSQFI